VNSAILVQKLWNYCNVLRDDGMGYGDGAQFSSSRFTRHTRPKFIKSFANR